MSPMKWFMLNMVTQSTIIQMVSFLNHSNSNHNSNKLNNKVVSNKLSWKW